MPSPGPAREQLARGTPAARPPAFCRVISLSRGPRVWIPAFRPRTRSRYALCACQRLRAKRRAPGRRTTGALGCGTEDSMGSPPPFLSCPASGIVRRAWIGAGYRPTPRRRTPRATQLKKARRGVSGSEHSWRRPARELSRCASAADARAIHEPGCLFLLPRVAPRREFRCPLVGRPATIGAPGPGPVPARPAAGYNLHHAAQARHHDGTPRAARQVQCASDRGGASAGSASPARVRRESGLFMADRHRHRGSGAPLSEQSLGSTQGWTGWGLSRHRMAARRVPASARFEPGSGRHGPRNGLSAAARRRDDER